MYGLGIAQPLKYSYSADLLDLKRCHAIDLTSRWKVRLRQQNQICPYKYNYGYI